jgi:hypothetical protein
MIEKTSFALATLIALVGCAGGLSAQEAEETSSRSTTLHVTHVLGFQGVPNNAAGDLLIKNDVLRFEKASTPGGQIALGSIKDVFVGEEDKQVGGTPLTLAKAAMPYGGGRVVGMFSHKKYDFVTIEYVDPNNGLHGAIFQLSKGQGQILRDGLARVGVTAGSTADQPANSENPGDSNEQ